MAQPCQANSQQHSRPACLQNQFVAESRRQTTKHRHHSASSPAAMVTNSLRVNFPSCSTSRARSQSTVNSSEPGICTRCTILMATSSLKTFPQTTCTIEVSSGHGTSFLSATRKSEIRGFAGIFFPESTKSRSSRAAQTQQASRQRPTGCLPAGKTRRAP